MQIKTLFADNNGVLRLTSHLKVRLNNNISSEDNQAIREDHVDAEKDFDNHHEDVII